MKGRRNPRLAEAIPHFAVRGSRFRFLSVDLNERRWRGWMDRGTGLRSWRTTLSKRSGTVSALDSTPPVRSARRSIRRFFSFQSVRGLHAWVGKSGGCALFPCTRLLGAQLLHCTARANHARCFNPRAPRWGATAPEYHERTPMEGHLGEPLRTARVVTFPAAVAPTLLDGFLAIAREAYRAVLSSFRNF